MENANKKVKPTLNTAQVVRHLIQLAAFLLMPGLFISAFSAVKDVYTALLGGTFSVGGLSYQLLLLLAVLPVTALMGRFFCGYFCAFGAMGDFVWFISGKLLRKQRPIGALADSILKLLKYAVLAFIIVVLWTLGVSFGSLASPWTIFGMYAAVSGWPPASTLLSAGAALLLLIIVGSFFVERFFCRYLCPLGAIFTLVSLPRLFRIRKPRASCGPCTLCTRKCAMGIRLSETDRVDSGECINCFKCVSACPRGNVRANPTPAVATAAASIAIAGMYYAGTLSATVLDTMSHGGTMSASAVDVSDASAASGPHAETVLAAASSAANPNGTAGLAAISPPGGQYADGVYTGSGTGFRGTIKASVTVSGGKITAIQIVSSSDDAMYMSRAKSTIISAILNHQSVAVSTVSGATFSSNGILEAVAKALSVDFTNPNTTLPRRR